MALASESRSERKLINQQRGAWGVEASEIQKLTASLIAHRDSPFILVCAPSYRPEIPRFLRQKEFGNFTWGPVGLVRLCGLRHL